MVKQGDVYTNPRSGTRLEVRELAPQRLIFERRYPPATGKADAHLHLDFTQRWEVVSGTATVGVDGETRTLGPRESAEIRLGAKHQDPYNETEEELVIRWQIEPVTEFIEGFMNAYAQLLARDDLNDQDEFPMLQLFVILRATKAKSYAANLPTGLQKATLPLLAAIGRIRGYQPSYSNGPTGQ
jgi:mannose-6-phosphate isomerase-like protein (cupin superfamily)